MAFVLGLAPMIAARADQVIAGGDNHLGAQIVGLERGRLRFRTADGMMRSAWIDAIELMIVDRRGFFTDFNQAERFLANGEPQRAITRYRRAQRLAKDFWRDLMTARLLAAYDAAGQLDQATVQFIRIVRGGPEGPWTGARLFPKVLPARRDAKVGRAIARLDATLTHDVDAAQGALFGLLLYEILHRYGEERSAEVGRRIVSSPMPEAVRSETAYTILLEALRQTTRDPVTPAALAGLDRAIRDCPERLLPSFLLLKGRVQMRTASTRDEVIRACWPFLRVAIHFPDDPRAADGLFEAARGLETIGRKGQAIQLLRECVAHKPADETIRQRAEAALSRLQNGENGSR